jgi:hypothetical protein
MAVARGGTPAVLKCLSGVTWAVLFGYDPDSGTLAPAAIRVPEKAERFPLRDALRQYRAVLAADQSPQRIDPSGFTTAGMPVNGFSTDTRLLFVNKDDQPA